MVGISNDRNFNIMPRDLRKQNKAALWSQSKVFIVWKTKSKRRHLHHHGLKSGCLHAHYYVLKQFVVQHADCGLAPEHNYSKQPTSTVTSISNQISFLCDVHTHTRACTFTALFPGLPRWAGTRKVKPIWILLKQETVSGSGISWAICKSTPCSRQITTPVPHHSVFYRLDALPASQPTASKHLFVRGPASAARVSPWRAVSTVHHPVCRAAGVHTGPDPVRDVLTVSCFSKIQIGFTFLVPAHRPS